MIRVLVADDHAVVRRGIREILTETPDITVTAEAATGEEVLPLVRSHELEVVVLDLHLGHTSGLEVLADIRREKPRLPVVILTVSPEQQYALRAVRSGAAGFLTKETAPEKLIEAVRRCAAGGRYLTEEVAAQLASYVARDTAAAHQAAPHQALSNRELQILELLASGKTVSEIGRALHLSVKTISTHRSRLLAKMNMRTNAELTHYAIKRGLVG